MRLLAICILVILARPWLIIPVSILAGIAASVVFHR